MRTSRPVVPAGFVHRGRLDKLLSEGVTGPLTVLSAGPGYGKSLAVAAWSRAESVPGPVAWLNVDDTDVSNAAFWSDVLGALTIAGVVDSNSPLREMVPAAGFGTPEVLRIAACIAEFPIPVILVLDDFHFVRSAEVLDSFGRLLAHQPRQLRIVLVSRIEPEVRLPRLRLDGGLTEIRADDLAFTEIEAREFCRRSGVAVAPDELNLLLGRTEGWPAGMRLALLSSDSDGVGRPRRFVEGHRMIAEYVREEVLGKLSQSDRDFLLTTSIVERVSGGLARELTDRPNSSEILEELVARNALVVRLADRGEWFGYHPLLREVLCERLASERPDDIDDLHGRAARWFGRSDDPISAIRHAALGGHWREVARVLIAEALPLIATPRGTALVAALAPAAAEAARHPTPDTLLAAAACHYQRGDFDAMLRDANDADDLLEGTAPAERGPADVMIGVLRLVHAGSRDPALALERSRRLLGMLENIPRQQFPAVLPYTVIARNNLGVAQLFAGSLDEAESNLKVTAEGSHRLELGSTEMSAHSQLALLDVIHGRFSEAALRADEAERLAERHGWSAEPQALARYAAQALASLETNRLDDADERIDIGLATRGPGIDAANRLLLTVAAVGVAVTRRDESAARTAAERLRGARARAGDLPEFLGRWCAAAEADICLLGGEFAAVLEMVDDPGREDSYVAGLERIALAKARIGLGQPDAALEVLGTSRKMSPYRGVAVEVDVLAAVAADQLRQDSFALTKIAEAVELAVAIGSIRPFLAAGARVPVLLERHRHVVAKHVDFTAGLLAAREHPGSPADPYLAAGEPLTERELIVLQYLPTMFKASEIAADLFISVNTVKTHQQAIYRKLGVSTRRDAVDRARELKLI
ncbi:LuxR C-terminal-related transcriptional regulator [Aldersonia sp. NBC_00410]|uniref:LuxR C-terminal-related transcriptional regulator n=1 Tax=Aldersonia sp. NBC_00410 TaxID=2975954 RepID=UPI002253E1BD|nr:LuxR C-terminal-related transcriptional regulator [Aldersonia sp. NBC_00410]MCX5041830.1 LuxR C-terminal-related transcriptional regulator [Aldersonia sp. NBC_00410]